MVKLTTQQLKQIIRETIEESLPRMSGMMNPEDPEVMADLERKKTWNDEERVKEQYAQEISNIAMDIHHTGSSFEEALRYLVDDGQISDPSPEEIEIMKKEAERQAEDL